MAWCPRSGNHVHSSYPRQQILQEFNPVPVRAEMPVWKMPGLNKHCFKFRSFPWLPYVQHSDPASSQPLGNLEGRALGLVKCSLSDQKQLWYSKGNHADKKSIKIHFKKPQTPPKIHQTQKTSLLEACSSCCRAQRRYSMNFDNVYQIHYVSPLTWFC